MLIDKFFGVLETETGLLVIALHCYFKLMMRSKLTIFDDIK
jgi:hypothetical protein